MRLGLLVLVCGFVFEAGAQPAGPWAEAVNDPLVASVQLYRGDEQLAYPVYYLHEGVPLTLAFDLLGVDARSLQVEILRCERDWTPSPLRSVEFSQGFVTAPMLTFQPSQLPQLPYVHYQQPIPWQGLRLTLSGNYIVTVTDRSNPGVPLLVKRFLVAEQPLALQPEVLPSTVTGRIRTHQRVRLVLPTAPIGVRDPTRELALTLLQNFRWDNAHHAIPPTYVYPDRLEYDLSDAVEFAGGNEFRQLDLRSLQARGQGVASVVCPPGQPCQVAVRPDEMRAFQRYYANPDLDGRFFLGLGRADEAFGAVEAAYVEARFSVSLGARFATESVVVVGGFTHWRADPTYALSYNPATRSYEGSFLLKQGIYNYAYAVVDPSKPTVLDLQRLEGSFFETRNTYAALVYYRPLGERADRLLGIAWVEGPQ